METGYVVHMGGFHAACLHHGKGASRGLLRGLEKELHTPGPFTPGFHQYAGRAKGNGHMGVMAAGMHMAGMQGAEGAGNILCQRQGVHVGPKRHRIAGAGLLSLDHGHDSRARHREFVGNAPLIQKATYIGAGPVLLKTRFGMLVQFPADPYQLGV